MGKGKRFELSIKNEINDNTDRAVKAHRPDFSGSSAGEVADVMVVWENGCMLGEPTREVAYIEVKKRGNVAEGNRTTVLAGSSQDQNGVEEIKELISESPYWTTQWVAVKFPHRELAVFNATELLNSLNGMGEVSLLDERLTPSNNVSMRKPTLDGWNSSSSGDADYVTLLKEISVPEDYINV